MLSYNDSCVSLYHVALWVQGLGWGLLKIYSVLLIFHNYFSPINSWKTSIACQWGEIWVSSVISKFYQSFTSIVFVVGAVSSLITRFKGLTWGPSGANRTQVGPMMATWTLPSGMLYCTSIDRESIAFFNFSIMDIFNLLKYLWGPLGHFHIWQVSPQQSCSNACQIWTSYLTVN